MGSTILCLQVLYEKQWYFDISLYSKSSEHLYQFKLLLFCLFPKPWMPLQHSLHPPWKLNPSTHMGQRWFISEVENIQTWCKNALLAIWITSVCVLKKTRVKIIFCICTLLTSNYCTYCIVLNLSFFQQMICLAMKSRRMAEGKFLREINRL